MRKLPTFIRYWLKGCREIVNYAEIPGYRDLAWAARKKLDHRAVCLTVCSAEFWKIVFIAGSAVLLAHILTWQFDLVGWQRDMLRCLPILMAGPGLAVLRRGLIEQLLDDRVVDSDTDF